MRRFDPVRLGHAEADAWIAYYRGRWWTFLRAAVTMVRVGFGLPIATSVHGAWYVLRANQVWAPYPENDPDAATAYMRTFYEIAARHNDEMFDVGRAATLEIAWWRAHRELQHPDAYPDATKAHLVDALANLYGYIYDVPAESVAEAAEARADAMAISDAWVAAGRDPSSSSLDAERQALVRGYTALLAAVSR